MATKKDTKFKKGISAILKDTKKVKERPKSVIIDPETIKDLPTSTVEKKAPGRKRKLKEGVNYVGVGSRIKQTTKDRMKVALVTNLKTEFASQDLFVDFAINFALDHFEKR